MYLPQGENLNYFESFRETYYYAKSKKKTRPSYRLKYRGVIFQIQIYFIECLVLNTFVLDAVIWQITASRASNTYTLQIQIQPASEENPPR